MKLIKILLLVLIPGLNTILANSIEVIPETFHNKLGKVIDSNENRQFNIFGEIQGFTAARIHNVADNHYLHILRNVENGAALLIIQLKEINYQKFLKTLKKRVNTKDPSQLEEPVYLVKESKLKSDVSFKQLILYDESELNVELLKAQNDTLFVRTLGGIHIALADMNIRHISELKIKQNQSGEFYHQDPNTSRLFFAPTGRSLTKGDKYFADYFLFFPTFGYGVTDNFTMSGGMSILPGISSQLVYFAPKFSWNVKQNIDLAAGLMYLAIPFDAEDVQLGYGVATFGDNTKGLTVGLGIPALAGSTGDPIILLGGEAQISNSAKFVTENWFFADDETTLIFSGGLRFFGKKLSVDLAFITTDEAFDSGAGFPFIPWIDFGVFW